MATRKPSTALGWFPHVPATDSSIIDMASARQIALRARLRNHYWLTEGKPIGESTVALLLKKMAMIDAKDKMTSAQVAEVLSDHYGFRQTPEGITVPDLDEARGVAVESLQAIQARASAGGRAKAEKAAASRAEGEPLPSGSSGTDF
jgi:hypothetical protein